LVSQLTLNRSTQNELRVAFPSGKAASSYEPTKIHLGDEYIFLENIYSPLLEIDPKTGLINSGLAKSYDWQGDDLILEIRNDSSTVSGHPINAEDVEFSLKRLLVLSGNTHGNFKDLVCPNANLSSIEESCEGIIRSNNKIILRAGQRKSFLVPMLAAIDFAIIPKSSVDANTLAIVNYKETSGPFYVDQDDANGQIVLKANPKHFRFSTEMPAVIRLVPVQSGTDQTSVSLFEDNKVDHITTIDPVRLEKVFKFAKSRDDVTIHTTHKIRTLSLVFTDKGIRDFSNNERHQIGVKIRAALSPSSEDSPILEKTDEFFSSFADGGLSPDQKIKIKLAYTNLPFHAIDKKLKIGIINRSDFENWKSKITEILPESEIHPEDNAPDFKKYNPESEKPHAFIASTDTGFSEDINLISYTIAAGFFGLSKEERQKWLAAYMENDSKVERLAKLKAIHFKALNDAVLVPISVAPFVAIIRKPWKMELSELYANNPLWLIKQ